MVYSKGKNDSGSETAQFELGFGTNADVCQLCTVNAELQNTCFSKYINKIKQRKMVLLLQAIFWICI